MKIKSITLQNYKQFIGKKEVRFYNPENGKINNKTLFVGKNGAGKTSVLQAIVMLVASATREGFTPESLDTEWEGFSYRLLGKAKNDIEISATIFFEDYEVRTAKEYAEKLFTPEELADEIRFKDIVNGNPNKKIHEQTFPESLYAIVELNYQMKRVTIGKVMLPEQVHVFNGNKYANQLTNRVVNKRELFEKIGHIYWYDEQRSWQSYIENDDKNLDTVRNFLANAYHYHIGVKRGEIAIGAGEFDFYAKLENLYKKVFPNRTFEGARPRFDIFEKAKAPDFFLSCNGKQYELAEMSAGERAIFPILMDFARWNINNSIIIIDEIELHLHPPLQQGFISVLEKLGKNNQFILTTHSDDVAYMFDESEIIRF